MNLRVLTEIARQCTPWTMPISWGGGIYFATNSTLGATCIVESMNLVCIPVLSIDSHDATITESVPWMHRGCLAMYSWIALEITPR